MPEMLNVRETAARLGVHENTVRNLEERGLLPATRLPGSGYRRFRVEDVDALLSGAPKGPDVVDVAKAIWRENVGWRDLDGEWEDEPADVRQRHLLMAEAALTVASAPSVPAPKEETT